MKQSIFLLGVASIADGVMHLLIPNPWNEFWSAALRRLLPGIGGRLERTIMQASTRTRRFIGLGSIGLGTLLIWLIGPMEEWSA